MANSSEDLSSENLSRTDSARADTTTFGNQVNCGPPTGINVLIVGGGLGGLSAAIECHRKGHNVRVFERSSQASAEGKEFIIIDVQHVLTPQR